MKLGEEVNESTMELLFSHTQRAQGRVSLKHVRNGRVVLERREDRPAVGTQKYYWVVVECEFPDKET